MRITFIFIYLVVSCHCVFAQWIVSGISEADIKSSKAVIRRYASDVTIIGLDQVAVAENLVVTFLDSDVLSHFRFRGIVSDSIIRGVIVGKVFNKEGKRVRQVKVSVFGNVDCVEHGSMLSLVSPTSLNFPLTIELEYKKVLDKSNIDFLWNPMIDYGVAVQSASLRLSVNDTSIVHFRSNKIPQTNNYINDDGLFVFLWELSDYKALKKGSSSELPINYFPSLRIIFKP